METAGDKPEEGGDDVKSSWPLCPGLHTCYNGRYKPSRARTLDGTNAIDRAGARGGWSRRIPRKEVIQPQLPLRLPCYDFTPITDSTFGRCLPCGLAHGLRVFPAFVV